MATRGQLMALPSLITQQFDSSFQAPTLTSQDYQNKFGTGQSDQQRLGMTDAQYARYLAQSTADVQPTFQAQAREEAYAPIRDRAALIAEYVNLEDQASEAARRAGDIAKEQIDMNPQLANTLETATPTGGATFTDPSQQGYGFEFSSLNTLPALSGGGAMNTYAGTPGAERQGIMTYDATTGQTYPTQIGGTTGTMSPPAPQQDLITQQTDLARQALINQIAEQQRQAEAGYEEAIAGQSDAYRQARTNADVQAQLIAKRMQERNANLGLATGSQAQQQLEQQTALMGTLGGLQMQEQAAKDALQRDLANVQAQGAFAQQQGELALQQQAIQNQIEQQRYLDSLAIQRAGLTGMYQGQPTMAMQNQMYNQMVTNRAYELQLAGFDADQAYQQAQLELQQAGLTGMYQGQPTLAGQQMQQQLTSGDIANQIAQIQLEALPTQIANDLKLAEQQYALGQLDYQTMLNKLNTASTTMPNANINMNTIDTFIEQIENNPQIKNIAPKPINYETGRELDVPDRITYDKGAIVRLLDELAKDPDISDTTLDYLASYYGI